MSAQLWHVGRMSHHSLQEGGQLPVAPSAIAAENSKCYIILPDGSGAFAPVDTPRALKTEEISGVVAQYCQAALRAVRAGFDFVEEHAANGYLLQQFMSTSANKRTDQYGGTLENRARLTLEVLDALCDAVGSKRVGLRLSPDFNINGIHDDSSREMTCYLAKACDKRGIAYLHIAEPSWVGGESLDTVFRQQIRACFTGPLIFCGGYTPAFAEETIEAGLCDMVAFGRMYIANPDLVERIRQGGPYNTPDSTTFYQGGAKGYTDYPFLGE